jgi:hypothetical protein
VRSERRSSVGVSPSQAAASWSDTWAVVNPRRPAAPGSISQVTSGFPFSTPTTSTMPLISSTLGSTSSASSSSFSGSSPKIFTSMGLGVPSRSPIMSCRSCTNSTSTAGTAFAALSRSSSITSSAERWRCPRGLRRTRMSPSLGTVAKRPISAPVRREKEATSGVSATSFSTLRICLSVSSSAVPAGVM